MKWFVAGLLVAWMVAGVRAQDSRSPSGSEATYTLSGTVVNAATGEPVRRALVQIFLGSEQAALTDGGGHFEFTGLPAGQSSVSARKPGFFSEQELELGQFEMPLAQVGPNAPPVTVRLFPEGIIAGSIESRDGERLQNLPVRLIREHVVNGRRRWEDAGSTNTDDDGQFRIGNLIPGAYYVMAGPSPDSLWQAAPGTKGREMTYPEVFYPGVRDLNAATPIQVAPGQQAEADLSITAEPVFKVSGALDAGENAGMSLEFLNSSGETLPVPTEYGPGGTFESKVVAGNYVLRANVFGQGTPMTGTVNLTVNSDLTGLRIPIAPVTTVPVRTTFQRTQQGGSRELIAQRGQQAINIRLTKEGPAFGNSDEWLSVAGTNDPAANSLRDLAPGKYSIEITAPGPRWYVRSAQCGGTDLLRDELTVVPGARLPAIEIVLRDDAAQLTGTALAGGRPAEASIIAVPDGAPRLSQVTPAGPDGRFSMDGLAPGDYSVVAVSRSSVLEYANPEAVASYLSAATRVSLVPNGHGNVQVNVVEVGK
jgi:hypothetical protein